MTKPYPPSPQSSPSGDSVVIRHFPFESLRANGPACRQAGKQLIFLILGLFTSFKLIGCNKLNLRGFFRFVYWAPDILKNALYSSRYLLGTCVKCIAQFDTFDGAKPRFLNRGKKCRSVSTLSIPQAPVLSEVEGSDRGVEWVDFKCAFFRSR